MTKRALILGIGGQDGSYLAELLLGKGYEVHGLVRHSSANNLWRIEHLLDKVTIHRGDLLDFWSVVEAIDSANPHELYNMADQDNVSWSEAAPGYQMAVTADFVVKLLNRLVNTNIRVFQPCSAMMFGDPEVDTQDENTPLDPRTPYAIAKTAAWHACRCYRRRGVKVGVGIMFNHDSPRRNQGYLLGNLCRDAVAIAAGRQDKLLLSNFGARVDVGYASDYVEAAWRILQEDSPGDYVVATGMAMTLGDLAELALRCAGVTGDPTGYITEDPKFWRLGSPQCLRGNISKIRSRLGWEPRVEVAELICMLCRKAAEVEK